MWLFLIFLALTDVYAVDIEDSSVTQQRSTSVVGRVTDKIGEPLPGATIQVKGSVRGVIADIDGNYEFPDCPVGETLVVSFVGMETIEIVEVKYTDNEGVERTVQFADSLLSAPVHITGFDVPYGVSYRTAYLPDTLAIDTFYTPYTPVEIAMTVNVALNKPARVSGMNSPGDSADKAVDGIIANDSRWVSPATGIHWLEIDLQGEHEINGFMTWTGANGNMSHPTKEFFFQVEINGEWVNIVEVYDNSEPVYGASFPEVVTGKVRYYVPEYSGNRVRLYDIEGYK